MRKIVFSDLDGTLLERDTYSHHAAGPALETLKERGIPLVLCSSKTRAEMSHWRERMDIRDPFIVENGGAIYVPRGYFPFTPPGSIPRGAYDVIELGTPYKRLVAALRKASLETGCKIRGFNEMSVAQVCLRTSLNVRQAELAKQREYDEPFEIRGPGEDRLLEAIERQGLRWTHGGRLYHIMGRNSKASAVRRLVFLFTQAFGSVTTIGVGDGLNDADFLQLTAQSIVIRSEFAKALSGLVPGATVTRLAGPAGWNESLLETLDSQPVYIH
jgi:mannosyl-3-phosphoglycerate phosphatase